jgi:hypothetical protein
MPPLTESQVEALLHRVCVELGLCLTPDTYDHLVTHAPTDVTSLTDAIFVAEGIPPATADRKLYGQVRGCVEEAFLPTN